MILKDAPCTQISMLWNYHFYILYTNIQFNMPPAYRTLYGNIHLLHRSVNWDFLEGMFPENHSPILADRHLEHKVWDAQHMETMIALGENRESNIKQGLVALCEIQQNRKLQENNIGRNKDNKNILIKFCYSSDQPYLKAGSCHLGRAT